MVYKSKWIVTLVALVALTLVGLGVVARASGKEDGGSLVDTQWALESFGPVGEAKIVLVGTEITLHLGAESKLHGSAGCSRYMSTYEAKGGKLSVGMIGATMMMCPEEGVMAQEAGYLKALESASGFEIGEGHLRVFYGNGEGVLNFVAAE